MSYQVYITRAEFWAENQGREIAADEWLELVRTDPQLELEHANGPCFALLTGSGEGADPWLDWSEGNVYCGYPSRTLQKKILQIADQLRARVQGDDGEFYASIEDFPETVERPPEAALRSRGLPAYRRRQIVWNVIIYGSIAAVIVAANVFDFW